MFVLVVAYQMVWLVVEGIAVNRFRTQHFESVAVSSESESRLPILIGILAAMFGLIVTVTSAVTPMDSVPIWRLWTSIALGGAGVLIRFFSIRELGPLFRDTIDLAPNQKRVETGLYRIVRHPAEIGFFLLLAGLFALAPGTIAFALLVLIEGFCIRRIYLENQLFSH